jgi:hypothetical protein
MRRRFGIGADLGVHQFLDLRSCARCDRLEMRKSKRSRSGATSEPFWVTWVPSTLRSAACSRCVAE